MSATLSGIERSYQIKGKEVHAKVIEANPLPSGAIEVLIQTSCLAPDGQIHHQTNSATLTDPSGGQQLEQYLYRIAEWLPKLLWEKQTVTLFSTELLMPNGSYANLTCTFNLEQPVTTIHPDWVRLAQLPEVGVFNPPENPAISFPVHRATLRFGKRLFQIKAVSANANALCVIGANVILEVIGENKKLLFDLFLSDVVRALGSAARSKERTVLVLGSYQAEGRAKLDLIRSVLERHGLEGVILSDFADIHQQSLFEKMLMFGSLARFVICDESAASGHLIELKACSDIGFVTAILRNKGKPVTWMNADIAAERGYLKIFSYDSEEQIEQQVNQAVAWAEDKIKERAAYYNREYPWRNPNIKLG